MTTFKTQLQLRKELAQKQTLIVNNNQVICENQEEVERLQAKLAHSQRNTLTDRAFTRR